MKTPNRPGIFVLLVGINQYPHPISGLNGCLKDINQIEHYLLQLHEEKEAVSIVTNDLPIQQYGDLYICKLSDDQATYSNIVNAFQYFLRQAEEQDYAWFHFSGHGAEQPTAPEFLAIEPNGKDQTLVTFQSGYSNDPLHLADKELAVLLYEVANFRVDGSQKNTPLIIVSLDCCHSGSGTREEELPQLKVRNLNDFLSSQSDHEQQQRMLSTYLSGHYQKQWTNHKKLEVPVAPHILFSACKSTEKAGDLPTGGIFTSSLIKALQSSNTSLTYADLFIRTRAMVRDIYKSQHPQFEIIGGYNPFIRFLDGTQSAQTDRYEIYSSSRSWYVKCGVIHGLPLAPIHPIRVEIFNKDQPHQKLGEGVVSKVGVQSSQINWITDQTRIAAEKLNGIIHFIFGDTALVGLTGNKTALENIKAAHQAHSLFHLSDDDNTRSEWALEIHASTDDYEIIKSSTGNKIVQWPQSADLAPSI